MSVFSMMSITNLGARLASFAACSAFSLSGMFVCPEIQSIFKKSALLINMSRIRSQLCDSGLRIVWITDKLSVQITVFAPIQEHFIAVASAEKIDE